MPRKKAASPPATVVCFVRHGTTPTTGKVLPGRAPGLHLSERGVDEAAEAAKRLEGVGVSAVYASPLERTRETAAVIGERLGLKVSAEKGLLECDFGEWTGRELAELSRLEEWRTVQQHPSGFRFPGGESFAEMRARIAATVERLVAKHRGQTIVAVSHADPIKVAIGDALGQPLDLVQRISVAPCSVSVVAFGAGPPVVLTTSSTGELSSLLSPHPPATAKRARAGAQR